MYLSLSIYLSVYIYECMSMYLSIFPYICMYMYIKTKRHMKGTYINIDRYISTRVYICMCVCLFVYYYYFTRHPSDALTCPPPSRVSWSSSGTKVNDLPTHHRHHHSPPTLFPLVNWRCDSVKIFQYFFLFLLIKYTILEQMSRKILQINFSFIRHFICWWRDLYVTDYERVLFSFPGDFGVSGSEWGGELDVL